MFNIQRIKKDISYIKVISVKMIIYITVYMTIYNNSRVNIFEFKSKIQNILYL